MTTHIKFVEKVEKAAEIISQIKVFRAEGQSEGYNQSTESYDSLEKAKDFIWSKFAALGISKEDEASHSLIAEGYCKEGDARTVFCERHFPVISVPWFRKIWEIFSDGQPLSTENETKTHGTSDVSGSIVELIKSSKPASQWRDRDLIEAYNIDSDGEISDELKKRSDGQAVVVFSDENAGIVDVEITGDLLRQSRRRQLPKIYKKDGKVYKLYVVGDFPSEIYEESPLAPGTLLFNGNCEVCGMDFSGVSKEARQFLRVAYNEEATPKENDRIAMLGLVAAAKSGVEELRRIFPEVGIVYDELAKTDELPSLKSVNAVENKSENSDPFGRGNQRY